VVAAIGHIGMGAQRWLDLKLFRFQPSELMKLAVPMMCAWYLHERPLPPSWPSLAVLAGLILVPVGLTAVQPDLGTAALIAAAGALVIILAGLRLRVMAAMLVLGALGGWAGWGFMHDYQRKRVLTFLDPDRDPLGAGYHITQSKIAIGSGGLFGKGFLQGTQSSLNFLPEKQTDFIFTTFVEEWGMVGALVLLALFTLVLVWGFSIALRSQHHFGRLVALGVTAMMFLYVFINIAMVIGLLPVVGVPLPLVSNGGTAMVSVMFACGLLIGVNVYRDAQLPIAR
jgi:rod shape determining protein RodA